MSREEQEGGVAIALAPASWTTESAHWIVGNRLYKKNSATCIILLMHTEPFSGPVWCLTVPLLGELLKYSTHCKICRLKLPHIVLSGVCSFVFCIKQLSQKILSGVHETLTVRHLFIPKCFSQNAIFCFCNSKLYSAVSKLNLYTHI